MGSLTLFCGLLVLVSSFALVAAERPLLCYYGTWATYRHGNGRCDVENLDPFVCTHLIYTFFGIETSGALRIIDPYLDLEENWGRGNIKKFNNLKLVNPQLKTLAAVGGWNEGSNKFSSVAKDPVKRKVFAETSLAFVLQHGFDGLDLDWEYPGQREGSDPAVDKENFVLLLEELRNAFAPHNLLLTAAVGAAELSAAQSYDIPKVSNLLDYVNLMAYDYHGTWDAYVGHNAPLYEGPDDTTELQKQLNIKASVEYWLAQGAPREKLILGMPLYGRSFSLANPTDIKPGALHNGPGLPGPFTNTPGMLGYNEFCEQQLSNRWTMEWEDSQQVPYAHYSTQWVGIDNKESIELKAKFVLDNGLAGAMVWSVETDDFLGLCGRKFPLLTALSIVLNEGVVPSTPAVTTTTAAGTTTTTTAAGATTTTTTSGSSTAGPSVPGECSVPGTFRDPLDCSRFYICTVDNSRYDFQCPNPLLFDTTNRVCNWAHLVDCTTVLGQAEEDEQILKNILDSL